jgi:predicted HTH transcriptional regulator
VSALLHRLIDEGEHQQQDFKFCVNDSKKIAKSLVAFANTDGGRLLIGIKDNGRIAGIKSDEEFYMIESAAKIHSKPAINFLTKQWHIDGKTVLEIQVESSSHKPHFAKDESGKWLAYIRCADENLLAHKIQIEVWKKQKSSKGIYFSYSDDEKYLINYLRQNPSISFSKFIRLAHISRKKAEEILSNFVTMEVLNIETSINGTLFSLIENISDSEIQQLK